MGSDIDSVEEYVKYLFNLSVMALVFGLIGLAAVSPIFKYFQYSWVFALVSGAISALIIVYIAHSIYKHMKNLDRPKI